MQEIWAKSPSFMTSLEKEKAPISGISKDNFDENKNENKNENIFVTVVTVCGHNSAEAGEFQ